MVCAPQLFSVLRSSGHFASMCQTVGKREREAESRQDSIDVGERKRFHGKETDCFLLQIDKAIAEEEEEKECAPNEEAVNAFMRIMEEEIGTTCSTSYLPSNSEENSAASYIFSGHETQTLGSDTGIDLSYLLEASDDELGIPPIDLSYLLEASDDELGIPPSPVLGIPPIDLSYLLEASDDELGIPPSPVLDLKHEICPSANEITEGLLDNAYLKSLKENWQFDDKFHNCPQFTLFEDTWDASQLEDYMNRDFVSQRMLFDGDFSVVWRLGTAGSL